MTIKKIILGASMATSVALYAASGLGTLSTSSSNVVSSELLSLEDVDVSVGNLLYTPKGIDATALKNPIFKFVFSDAIQAYTSGVQVYELNTSTPGCSESNVTEGCTANKLVADNPQLSNSDKTLAFTASDASIFVYNDKTYVLDTDANASNGTADVNITMKKTSDPKSLTAIASLFSGDSQAEADSTASTQVASVKKEYSASVTTKFNARISAAESFLKFYDQGNGDYDDNMTVSIVDDGNYTNPLLPDSATIYVEFDQNLSSTNYSHAVDNGSMGALNDFNTTTTDATRHDTNTTTAYTLQLKKIAADEKFEKTQFKTHVYLTKTVSGTAHTFDLIAETDLNAGAWTLYGYQAQIPKVTYETVESGGNFIDTKISFTNRSALTVGVYFTVYAEDGTPCDVEDPDALVKNTSKEYKFGADILAQCQDGFPTTGSFSVEVSIPTTPDSVYGFASFKNKTLGQFKDLPLYNTSTMAY